LVKTGPSVLLLTHGVLEAHAAGRYSEIIFDQQPERQAYSFLWLFSCISFCLYALFTAYTGFLLHAVSARFAVQAGLGIALFAGGVSLRLAALRALGGVFGKPAWQVLDVTLKTDGIFSLVRHPSELGLAMICLGLALASDSKIALGI